MSIAQFAVPDVLAPLNGLWRWFMSAATQHKPMHTNEDPHLTNYATDSLEANINYAGEVQQTSSNLSPGKPLRVVRILEAGQAPTHVGRMVISGRMADVCAELDRLVAREQTLH